MAPQIAFKKVSYNYSPSRKALDQVTFKILPGSFTMVIGQTGSGKSTLIQQINGLLKPTEGLVKIGKLSVTTKTKLAQLKKLRQIAGLVFQIPQDQLFGETVRDDLSFGPINFGFNRAQVKATVKKSAQLLHLTSLLSRSPFDLSGGQMKRVAIAGVLACHPRILILDEPTVGLDSYGENHIMKVINDLRRKDHLTVVMVTHRMNLVAKYATQVIVLNRGKLVADLTPKQLFTSPKLLQTAGLIQPFAVRMAVKLLHHGVEFNRIPLTTSNLADKIAEKYKKRHYHE